MYISVNAKTPRIIVAILWEVRLVHTDSDVHTLSFLPLVFEWVWVKQTSSWSFALRGNQSVDIFFIVCEGRTRTPGRKFSQPERHPSGPAVWAAWTMQHPVSPRKPLWLCSQPASMSGWNRANLLKQGWDVKQILINIYLSYSSSVTTPLLKLQFGAAQFTTVKWWTPRQWPNWSAGWHNLNTQIVRILIKSNLWL